METYELWDRLTGRASTIGDLNDSLDRDRIFYESMMHKLQEAGYADVKDIRSRPTELFAQFAASRRHLVDQLMADPEGYCSPRRYLESVERLSSPPVKIVVQQGGIAPESALGFDGDGWYLYAGRKLTSNEKLIGMIVSPPLELAGVVHVDRRTAFDAYTSFALSDILFGPDIVDVPESDWESTDSILLGKNMDLIRINR
jgi:hypothetical protein